ncbi:MAG: hypothetical protein K0S47_3183 [Herbinix sp.]|jgi:hypothetical protein|nr:hypothetical protein [Herbinix sp.]
MNKEKQIIETIQHKAWGVNKTTRPVYGQGQYDMAYEILEEVQKIIQSEPEESKECQILHNQLMETEKELLEIRVQRDYWHREALKYCAELGEIRIKLGSK